MDRAMSAERGFVIEEVRDLDSAWAELTELFTELNDHHAPWLPRRLRDDWQQRLRDFVHLNDDRLILIARQNGAAVGYLSAEIRRDYGVFDELNGYIGDAYVRAAMRGQGIGSAMLSQAESWCRSRSASELRLSVITGNDLGFSFWTRNGFAPMSVTMKKSLSETEMR